MSGRFPVTREAALEFASLMAQMDLGECSLISNKSSANNTISNQGTSNVHRSPKSTANGTLSPPPCLQNSNTLNALNNVHGILMAHSNQALNAIDKFYPYRYRDQLGQEGLAELQAKLLAKWRALKGKTQSDCVRAYLNSTRKWPYFGASLFQVSFISSVLMLLALISLI